MASAQLVPIPAGSAIDRQLFGQRVANYALSDVGSRKKRHGKGLSTSVSRGGGLSTAVSRGGAARKRPQARGPNGKFVKSK